MSKRGLDALEEIKNCCLSESIVDGSWVYIKDDYEDECEIIEQELKAYQELKEQYEILKKELADLHENTLRTNFENAKKLQALEIIKEKGIILQFIKETYTVEQYNVGVYGTLVKQLTQEEYNLLKEALL